ncbi:hypothetical protein LOZ55_006068 [Ophidiomyces ophidiicola]|nr:hypothetical protein LOZ55_006068 [Ophidiomyces ophidiicola]KAI1978801.1 hypothetical protein LOZ54_006232 [Ophidiomyces ophidiicola]
MDGDPAAIILGRIRRAQPPAPTGGHRSSPTTGQRRPAADASGKQLRLLEPGFYSWDAGFVSLQLSLALHDGEERRDYSARRFYIYKARIARPKGCVVAYPPNNYSSLDEEFPLISSYLLRQRYSFLAMVMLSSSRYGKDNVKVCKVHRDAKSGTHTVVEMTVSVLLEGDIETSYTAADNSVIVATDSIKNTIYILAKQHPVTPPELFAAIVGTHFIETYKHIHAAHVHIVTHRWTRMTVDGKPHPHSFSRDGTDVRITDVDVVEGKGIDIKSAISGLLLLKSTGSQFHGFVRDEFTTLPETWDRILSTEIDANWTWLAFKDLNQVKAAVPRFDQVFASARDISLRLFAQDDSASVQNTMYKMAREVVNTETLLNTVSYSLPNKHYFELDLSWHKNLKNKGKDAEVYVPSLAPNGLIQCTVARDKRCHEKSNL